MGAGSAGSAQFNACVELRRAIARQTVRDEQSALFGAAASDVAFCRGRVIAGSRAELLKNIVSRFPAPPTVEGTIEPGEAVKRFAFYSYAAYFAEVAVDADTCETRVRRMLGVFDAGRILNARLARSQFIGGMIWGLSLALFEEGVIDPRDGSIVTHDLAGYHFAAHADAPPRRSRRLRSRVPISTATRLAAKALGSSASVAPGRPSLMQSSTPLACRCGLFRSRSTRSWRP
jgi:xanthine dehydrogenase YagR molybdenum-binding subunit